jgi:phage FluMu protein Com
MGMSNGRSRAAGLPPRRNHGTSGALNDIRCQCGKLVAKWELQGISIKCTRCQRLVSIPYHAIEGKQPEILPKEGS